MPNIMDLSDFAQELIKLAEQRGFEIKTTKDEVSLYPTFDQAGSIGDWFAIYIRVKPEVKCPS